MIDTDEPAPGFDIGVDPEAVLQPTRRGRRARSQRSLPMWGVVALALVVGWLLGSLVTGSATESPIETPSRSAVATPSATPEVDPVSDRVVAPASQTVLPAGSSLVVAQLSGSDRLPSAITSTRAAGSSTVRVNERIAGPTQVAGQVGRRVQVVGDAVVFIAGREVLVTNVGSDEPPEPIADAATLLAGSGSGDVWALSADSRKVQLIDVASRRVRATYDLSSVGVPVASHDGGLVVVPDIDRFGAFALWSPARGIERLWALDQQTEFVGAAGNTIVVNTPQGLASYNTVTGSLSQVDSDLAVYQVPGALVSPTGAYLAVVQAPASRSGVRIGVIDLVTGETVDRFNTGAPWLLTWASDGSLLYLASDPERWVLLRDTALGFDRAVGQLDSDATWMVIVD